MKIVYLILAHDNPTHLLRLTRALASSSSACFIHIDRKARLEDFAHINADDVRICQERIPVYWGDFSQIEAILVLLRSALAEPRRFGYFVLLSGTDYPLQSASYIERFFERNGHKEFMNIVPMPCEAAGKPITRLTTYKPRPGDAASKIAKFVRKLLVKNGAWPTERDYKPHLGHLVPYGGSQWWALSREACEYIERFVAKESRVVNFFKNTICPDESFFQTILGNSPYKGRIQRNLTYADWTGGGSSPAHITERHLGFLSSTSSVTADDAYGIGEVLFARKFSDHSGDIVAQIDRRRSFDLQPILEGELLRLRPLRPEDWDDLYAVASDPLIWEQHPSRDRYKEEVFKGFFSEALASGGALIAIDAKDGRVIGSSRFHGYDREKSEIEIGWTFLARSCWGGIYNAEMKELMLRHAFRFVRNVVFVIGPQNLRSQRAVEKIGAVRVGSGPRADGTGQDSFLYRILAPRSPSGKD